MIHILSPEACRRCTEIALAAPKPRPVLRMTWGIVEHIGARIAQVPAESGGAFGGVEGEWDVTAFHFDESSRTSSVTYSPDHEHLNRLFKNDWKPNGIRLRGFVHSHPGQSDRPSHGDEIYAERILKAIPDMKILWLPIVNTIPDTGGFSLTPWGAVLRNGSLHIIRGALEIFDVPRHRKLILAGLDATKSAGGHGTLSRLHIPAASSSNRRWFAGRQPKEPSLIRKNGENRLAPVGDTFQRVETAYDLPRMAKSRIVAVGAGGAAEWIEQLARAGIGQFVLIDHDTVSETNLATQQVYRRDIGRPKVDCIAERIRDINPNAKVLAIQKSLDDIPDDEFAQLSKGPLEREPALRTLLCGLTDNFFAQARVNRLALNLGMPSLNGQVYQEGRGCEITFTYPGVTPACQRCALSSRYRYYLDRKQENPVTSQGTPIFATARLNATKGFIALALLHHGSNHPRWGDMLKRIGDRNLVVVRMDPDFSTSIGMRTFDKVFANADKDRLFFDETIWLPQKPECPATGHEPCPDCGGTGDLRDSIGKIAVTDLRDPANKFRARVAEDAKAGRDAKINPLRS
jgi:hypothetical protein